MIEKARYHITAIERQEVAIAALKQRLGWKAWVTNAAQHTNFTTAINRYCTDSGATAFSFQISALYS